MTIQSHTDDDMCGADAFVLFGQQKTRHGGGPLARTPILHFGRSATQVKKP